MTFLRKISKKPKWDREINENVRKIVGGQKPVSSSLEKEQLSWYGHDQKRKCTSLLKKIIETSTGIKRKRQGQNKSGLKIWRCL